MGSQISQFSVLTVRTAYLEYAITVGRHLRMRLGVGSQNSFSVLAVRTTYAEYAVMVGRHYIMQLGVGSQISYSVLAVCTTYAKYAITVGRCLHMQLGVGSQILFSVPAVCTTYAEHAITVGRHIYMQLGVGSRISSYSVLAVRTATKSWYEMTYHDNVENEPNFQEHPILYCDPKEGMMQNFCFWQFVSTWKIFKLKKSAS